MVIELPDLLNLPNYQITHLPNLSVPDLLRFPVQHRSDSEKSNDCQRERPDSYFSTGNADWNVIHRCPDQQSQKDINRERNPQLLMLFHLRSKILVHRGGFEPP